MSDKKRFPRWAKILIGVVLGLVVVFYVGGGFFFSNMIHADALTPTPPTPDYGIYIIDVGEDTITITSLEERADSKHPGTLGLDWGTGYGHIGEIQNIDGLDVTRAFTLTSGVMPEACAGQVRSCDEADIEGYAYEADPSEVGITFSDVSYTSPIGELGAWQIDSGDGSVWAIHAHGWRTARRETVRMLPSYSDAGITSLVIDMRNDPGAPDDPTGIYRFGLTEWEDVEGAVQYALANGAEEIILAGYSTGSSAHLAFLENSDLADRVTAVVFDSPNIAMGETVKVEAAKRTIPGTPIPIPGSLTWAALLISDVRWDVNWGEVDYRERAPALLTMPTLVFHGADDQRVPLEFSEQLADNVPTIRLVVTPEAGHVRSWNIDPQAYLEQLTDFLESVS